MAITLSTTAGLEVGCHLQNARTGKILKVVAVSGSTLTVRPLRVWETRWARLAAFWASLAAVLGWLGWLLAGAMLR